MAADMRSILESSRCRDAVDYAHFCDEIIIFASRGNCSLVFPANGLKTVSFNYFDCGYHIPGTNAPAASIETSVKIPSPIIFPGAVPG